MIYINLYNFLDSFVLCCSSRHLIMADDGASDSEGSDISGVGKFINEDFEGELAGENVDPLPWIECRMAATKPDRSGLTICFTNPTSLGIIYRVSTPTG